MRVIIIALFYFLFVPTSAFSAVALVNPETLYFSKPNKLALKKVEEILIDAVDRSSSPDILWSIEETKKNRLLAKVVVRNKHTAFININYDQKKINIEYESSKNLRYEKINDYSAVIHPNYLKWINYLVSKVKFATKKYSEYSLVNVDPTPRVKKKGKGKVNGDQLFVLAAQAEPGKRDDEYELSYTEEKFSATLLNKISQIINKSNPEIAIKTIAWGKTIKNLIKESKNKEFNKRLCETHQADKILYANAPHMPGGQGSRDITYYLYICSSDRKIMGKFEINRNDRDTYGYEFALHGSTLDFIKYSNAYH